MVGQSPALRAAFFLTSMGVHFAALSAAEHTRVTALLAPAAATTVEIPIEVASPPRNSPKEPLVTTSSSFVPPSEAARERAPRHRPQSRSAPSPEPIARAAATGSPLATASSAPPVFAMTVRDEARSGGTSAAGDNPSERGEPLSEAGVSSPAHLVHPIDPTYPADARAANAEADVVLAIVVSTAGAVVDARVAKSAGDEFDDAALHAARKAQFVPAERSGHPVAVRMRWTISFRLR